MGGEYVTLKISNGSEMRGCVARPERGNGCGVVILQEAFGVNAHIRNVAERFAREGYLAIAPELYHRSGVGVEILYTDGQTAAAYRDSIVDEPLAADLRAAYDWLKSQVGEKIASVGFCMGGRASFFANEVLPLTCAVSFYGGRIAETLLEKAEDLHGPQLMLWGGLDKHIKYKQKRAIVDRLEELKKSYVNVDFSDADHGFFCDARANYNPKAAAIAWPLTLAFLKQHCG
ncbi:hypothetical protein A3D66_00425 [Candidatus Kaiserbacteria bacterium RIFCSPHIGHO2_02_FULL_50_9]|uniref:Dienelactone hydrolase domain-containing protein n=1 Tax=Candidatus Kaiserbacteria bacterium RIFCSPLOWO2_01_FULL_51_21 TaxID=1798508 RepID=A0A1F6ECZ5_9BACT|nr:MAG: hypothetical protein A2761_01905 [Candidatus Kaiserbacteria bacterium RIFCSPHIGHO2_01_FULL_51_33]OGG63190.1 MAG: hypothetical protein A3D66_00425 [Candidatus Kaiserbacteria bacterium RIFCSPHIGHO2_02_FULL_50_9]OGG71554.1 MAG: hypothetical protein A3A35_00205 [Candidatus Kaiserbacteria bacterium RIFCSPLOWO2_01_FULL_51_21]